MISEGDVAANCALSFRFQQHRFSKKHCETKLDSPLLASISYYFSFLSLAFLPTSQARNPVGGEVAAV
jgi:hypothetical protein